MTTEEMIVRQARAWLGTPYRHQASAMGVGTDCLGLIRGVWRALVGREPEAVPVYTPSWGEANNEEVLIAKADQWLWPKQRDDHRDGDVIVFRMRSQGPAKHLAICASREGRPTFIHAYTGHGVVESDLTQPWQCKIVARYTFPLGEK
jgi:NlpC/P60 family putative phage cell wall peptidase